MVPKSYHPKKIDFEQGFIFGLIKCAFFLMHNILTTQPLKGLSKRTKNSDFMDILIWEGIKKHLVYAQKRADFYFGEVGCC